MSISKNVDYSDFKRFLSSREYVSLESIAKAFSLSEEEAKDVLRQYMSIGMIASTPEEGDPSQYEVLEGDDPFVEIHSLYSIWKRVENEPHKERIAVLSFGDNEEQFPSFDPSIPHFRIVQEDVDYPAVRDFDSFFLDADEAAKFIRRYVKEGRTILCQCEYGVSRSAGAAAAILEAYNGDGLIRPLDRECGPLGGVLPCVVNQIVEYRLPFCYNVHAASPCCCCEEHCGAAFVICHLHS